MRAQPMRSILAATDLGPASDAIVRSAGKLARGSGGELHLLHVLELGDRRYADDSDIPPGFLDRVRAAERALDEQARRTLPEGVRPASQRVMIYTAHRAVLDRARDVRADLIVVGPHRGGEAGAHFLGTTADRVLRSATVPCLVVRQPLRLPLRAVGVPTDFSDPSRGALEVALTVAAAARGDAPPERGPRLLVLHAGWTVERTDNPGLEEDTILPALREQLREALPVLDDVPPPPTAVEVRWGTDPVGTILGWAREREVDLLVLATHGRNALQRALIGSVASKVARRAECGVMMVPPRLWEGVEQ